MVKVTDPVKVTGSVKVTDPVSVAGSVKVTGSERGTDSGRAR